MSNPREEWEEREREKQRQQKREKQLQEKRDIAERDRQVHRRDRAQHALVLTGKQLSRQTRRDYYIAAARERITNQDSPQEEATVETFPRRLVQPRGH